MIKLWIERRSPFYIERLLNDDSIDLTRVLWFSRPFDVGNGKIDADLLTRGYEFS